MAPISSEGPQLPDVPDVPRRAFEHIQPPEAEDSKANADLHPRVSSEKPIYAECFSARLSRSALSESESFDHVCQQVELVVGIKVGASATGQAVKRMERPERSARACVVSCC